MKRVMSLAEFEQWAAELGRDLPYGSVVWLTGPLGAGKTTFVRAFASGRGATGEIASPTYSLVHRYQGPRGVIRHLDCYRMRSQDEAADLDWEEIADADVVLIEWPDRAGPWALPPTVTLTLSHHGEDARVVESDR